MSCQTSVFEGKEQPLSLTLTEVNTRLSIYHTETNKIRLFLSINSQMVRDLTLDNHAILSPLWLDGE